MRKQASTNKQNEGDELKEALAVLISCTRSRRRPLPLTDIAKWLDIAIMKLGSHHALSDRIGLSAQMLRQFAAVKQLTRPVQDLFGSRRLDSVDAAAQLAMLPSKDQERVAKALAEGSIRTKDVRAVVQLRQVEHTAPIESLIQRIVESQTKHEYIAEFIIRGGRTREELTKVFESYIPAQEIIRVETEGALGRLVLTKKGNRSLSRAAGNLGVSLERVIPTITKKCSAS